MGYILNVAVVEGVEDLLEDLPRIGFRKIALFGYAVKQFTAFAEADIAIIVTL